MKTIGEVTLSDSELAEIYGGDGIDLLIAVIGTALEVITEGSGIGLAGALGYYLYEELQQNPQEADFMRYSFAFT